MKLLIGNKSINYIEYSDKLEVWVKAHFLCLKNFKTRQHIALHDHVTATVL